MAELSQYGWILAIITVAFLFSAFGNGANDVANSYATSVAARTLTMAQAGILAFATEFVGAVALGSRVTNTIKNNIIGISRFNGKPGALMLTMTCAEIGSAVWLMVASRLGLPVSTTHTIVGALVGAGIASGAPITWSWKSGSVSQIAASWAIAPTLSAVFAAILFATLKYSVLERKDAFKWGMRLIPFYLAFTGSVLALFITIEAPTAASLEELGAGRAIGIVFGTFFGVLLIAIVFFKPYFHRRLVLNDSRVKAWHIPLGPLLRKDNPPLYWPGKANEAPVKDYYANQRAKDHDLNGPADGMEANGDEKRAENLESSLENGDGHRSPTKTEVIDISEPRQRFLLPTQHLPFYHPARLWSWTKFLLLQGVTRDCVTYKSEHLAGVHASAAHYDNKVEHLWTYAQVASAMMMSIAHGSNDVANAVGPWVATYHTFKAGRVQTKSPTPVWILIVAGFMLAAGFWFFGYHVTRSLGNRITRMSPTRGFSVELGAAMTVLIASRLSLPVSTTQCLAGAVVGVGLMNYSLSAINWRQMLFIFSGWILTLPIAGLISGLLLAMALNAPSL